ncbi:MAG: family 43 glycosylhydrolase [Firmicutes bacterium]|nr:family 43 glycosylhydrolase [Bacillota bacterium]
MRHNPLFKGVFIPDVEARVFSDGRAYFYGSRDKDNESWCSGEYLVFSTADMRGIAAHGVSITMEALKGCKGTRLFAPDCIERGGKYYLYLCCNDESEWVASGDTPMRFGNAVQIKNIIGIDPAVFVDDDGQAYYYWGQFELNGAKLKDSMTELAEGSAVAGIVTQDTHFFHEGSSVRKRNGVYYLVFADVSRGDKTTPFGGTPTCLGYATSVNPLGPFVYRGVIIDNASCDPKSWNNHGSIECIDGQWYVFYHRATCGNGHMRRACCEKIFFDGNGLIQEVPMTSSGAAEYIEAGKLDAELFCSLSGACYLAADESPERLTNIHNGDTAIMRYIKLDSANMFITVEGCGKGRITVTAKDMQNKTAVIADMIFSECGKAQKFPIKAFDGICELIFSFDSVAGLEIIAASFS